MASPGFVIKYVPWVANTRPRQALCRVRAPSRRRIHITMKRRLDSAGVEYITLESFIKVQGVSTTGGQAKLMITNGEISVNGERETRRGRKLRQGDVVFVDDHDMHVYFDDNNGSGDGDDNSMMH